MTVISRQDLELSESKATNIDSHISELIQISQISRDIALNIGSNNLDTWNNFINLSCIASCNKSTLNTCHSSSCPKCKSMCDSLLNDYIEKCSKCIEISDNEVLRENTLFQENLELFKHTLSVSKKLLGKEDSIKD